MTVIKTEHTLEIGRVYGTNPFESMTDSTGELVQCPAFRVIKQATIEEYQKAMEEYGWTKETLKPEWTYNHNYYWVLMD